jgi:hypothetical protein
MPVEGKRVEGEVAEAFHEQVVCEMRLEVRLSNKNKK